jgi:hypothetical protein
MGSILIERAISSKVFGIEQHDLLGPLNRLPLPSFLLLDDVAQACEGEMKGLHQGFLGCGSLHKPTLAGQRLFRREVKDRVPVELFQVDGMERSGIPGPSPASLGGATGGSELGQGFASGALRLC